MDPTVPWALCLFGFIALGASVRQVGKSAILHPSPLDAIKLDPEDARLVRQAVIGGRRFDITSELSELALAYARYEWRFRSARVRWLCVIPVGIDLILVPLYLIPGSARIVGFVQLLVIIPSLILLASNPSRVQSAERFCMSAGDRFGRSRARARGRRGSDAEQ